MNNRDAWVQKIRSAINAADVGPTDADLAEAPVLDYWRPYISHQGAPILWGIASGHPKIKEGWVSTSQLVAIDPDKAWARTVSRWYALSNPFSDYEAIIARDLRIEKASPGFVQFDVPGYRPFDDMSLLGELLAAWRERMERDGEGKD
jgi:hypothetical protein